MPQDLGGDVRAAPWLLKQPIEIALQRLKVVKAAWIMACGESVQTEVWFEQRGSKEQLVARLRKGLAHFEAEMVPCPAGLQEAVLAEDFGFDACMSRFGLDWGKAMAVAHGRGTSEAKRHPGGEAAQEGAAEASGGEGLPVGSGRFGPRPRVRLCEERFACPRAILPPDAEHAGPHREPEPGRPRISNSILADASMAGFRCADVPPFLGAIPEDLALGRTAPGEAPPWRTLLIVGPSGAGKTSLLRSIHAALLSGGGGAVDLEQEGQADFYPGATWSPGVAVIEQFAGGAEEARGWLCGVGLSSVPDWCKPHSALSRGERYRANVARALADADPSVPLAFDEWTSELDRGVARGLCAAVRRRLAARLRRGQSDPVILFATCHDDVVAHLAPDVVVRCQAGSAPAVVRSPRTPAACLRAVFRGVLEPMPAEGTMVGQWQLQRQSEILDRLTIRARTSQKAATLELALPGEKAAADLRPACDSPDAGRLATEADALLHGTWLSASFPTRGLEIRVQLVQDTLEVQFRQQLEGVIDLSARVTAARAVRKRDFAAMIGECPHSARERSTTYESKAPGRQLAVSKLWHLSEEEERAVRRRPADRTPPEQELVRCLASRVDSDIASTEERLASLSESPVAWEEARCTRLLRVSSACAGWLSRGAEGEAEPASDEAPPCCDRLLQAGWFCPPRPDVQFPGLRVKATLGTLPAFRNDPRKEAQAAGLAHLCSYVGGADGKPSPGLQEAARPLDDGFDGLLVHAVPPLPLGADGVQDFALAAVIGPSGSGKSTCAREHFGQPLAVCWDEAAPALAHFEHLDEAADALSAASVGLAVALRPVGCLSGGERERLGLAWVLAEWAAGRRATLVLDEFTSLLDRAAARSVARGVQAFVRERPHLRGLVVLSCHADVIGKGLLEPDWVFDCASGRLTALSQRGAAEAQGEPSPPQGLKRKLGEALPREAPTTDGAAGADELVVRRALPQEWRHFREHHYKDHRLHPAPICFVGTLAGRAVAFTAVVSHGVALKWMLRGGQGGHPEASAPHAGLPPSWGDRQTLREHRTVVLPDSQGMGLGSLMADLVAHLCTEMGYGFISVTAHPTYGGYRDRSPLWSALPASQRERAAGHCRTFSHLWLGATCPDGGEDPERASLLRNRIRSEGSLTGVVQV